MSRRRITALLLLLLSLCFVFTLLVSSSRIAPVMQQRHIPVTFSGRSETDADKMRAVSMVASRVAQLQQQLDALSAVGTRIKSEQASSGDSVVSNPAPRANAPVPFSAASSSSFSSSSSSFSSSSSSSSIRPPRGPSDPIPVLVVACCRASYLRQTLSKLSSLLPPAFRIVVSQDGSDAAVTQLLHVEFPSLLRLQHTTDGNTNYEKIARHYGWALRQVLDSPHPPPYVIVLEDDMDIAPDFFHYFDAMFKVAHADPTVFAVSAWNDNGFAGRVRDADAVYRTDVFPGLGWMITIEIWREIGGKWPLSYWDEWMRLPEVHKGRSVLRPEVCRTRTFGEQGSSAGQFFKEYLSRIELSTRAVEWSGADVSYLGKQAYDDGFFAKVRSSRLVRSVAQAEGLADVDARVMYSNFEEFVSIARELRIMQDEKNGLPRASYKGVVVVRVGERASVRLFITPTTAARTD